MKFNHFFLNRCRVLCVGVRGVCSAGAVRGVARPGNVPALLILPVHPGRQAPGDGPG